MRRILQLRYVVTAVLIIAGCIVARAGYVQWQRASVIARLKAENVQIDHKLNAPEWLLTAGKKIDGMLPRAWQLNLQNWTIFQRFFAIRLGSQKDKPHVLDGIEWITELEEVRLWAGFGVGEPLPALVETTNAKSRSPRTVRLPREIHPEFIDALRSNPKLERLFLHGHWTSSRIFSRVKSLPHITHLWLVSVDVDDAAMAEIGTMRNIKFLSFVESKCAGPGMAHLRKLPLKEVVVSSSRLSLEGLRQLEGMPYLRKLTLTHTDMSNEMCRSVRKMPAIDHLIIACNDKTFGGEYLAGHPRLRTLDIRYTYSNDKELLQLVKCLRLKQLYIDSRNRLGFSSKGVAKFRRLRPDVKVN